MLATPTTLETVASLDGTKIVFTRAGSGSPLILVHGTGADRNRWAAVTPLLAEQFTVCALDRRGRGLSGYAATYAVQREYEDIAAVAAAFPAPVNMLGHSFGAACVLGAAPTIPNLRRLVLYEPPMLHEQHTPQRDEWIERMEHALEAGEPEMVVLILMHEMLQIPMVVIEKARTTTAWAAQLASAHTIPRELRASDVYGADPDCLRSICAPALFLLGSASPQSFKETTQTLCGLLPNSQVVVLEGQQHSAMLASPALFVQAILPFLTD